MAEMTDMTKANCAVQQGTAVSPCVACPVREWALCQPIPDEELDIVDRFKTGHREIDAGADIYIQGAECKELYTVIEGWGFQYKLLEDGRRQITRIVLPGDFIGYQPDLYATADHSTQALTKMNVCVFPRDNILDLFREHPQLALRMTWLLARDESRSQEWLTNIGRRSARERVAYLLLELYYRVRLRDPEPIGSAIPLPLTQEHIGDTLGLTSVHVNRTLRDLREKELLTLSNRTLRIVDPDGLAEIAGFEPETVERLQP